MSKERIEEIRRTQYQMDKDQAMKVMAESHRESVKELKESIEGHIKVKQVLADKLHDSRKENKRYHDALGYYADELNYIEEDFGSPWLPDYRSEVQDDGGEVARKALEGDNDG